MIYTQLQAADSGSAPNVIAPAPEVGVYRCLDNMRLVPVSDRNQRFRRCDALLRAAEAAALGYVLGVFPLTSCLPVFFKKK